jgi:general secretion pathway protein G
MRHNEKGFGLIEILIVVVVIAIVAAIAIPNVLNALQRSKRSRAMAEIKAVMSSLGSAMKESGTKPEVMENVPIASVFSSATYTGPTKDPWGGEYLLTFNPDAGEFIIMSLGKDRVAGAAGGEFDSDIIFRNGQFTAPAPVAGN